MHSRPNLRKRCGKRSVTDRELWSLLSTSLEKKKANKRKRDPDMLRDAVLELTVQRLNEEITERCLRKVKRRKVDDSYEWRECPNGLGWNMTASYQDDEDILGIDDFFQRINSCQKEACLPSYTSQSSLDILPRSQAINTIGCKKTRERTCRSEIAEDNRLTLLGNDSCIY